MCKGSIRSLGGGRGGWDSERRHLPSCEQHRHIHRLQLRRNHRGKLSAGLPQELCSFRAPGRGYRCSVKDACPTEAGRRRGVGMKRVPAGKPKHQPSKLPSFPAVPGKCGPGPGQEQLRVSCRRRSKVRGTCEVIYLPEQTLPAQTREAITPHRMQPPRKRSSTLPPRPAHPSLSSCS